MNNQTAYDRLEPDAGKLACPVLRGGWRGNAPSLPDIRKLPSSGGSTSTGFYFKPTLLRRMDAITYDSDKFGRVTDDHVRKFRRSTIDDFKKIGSGHHSDETIFKNSVTILDNIDLVAVSSETERMRVLDIFHRHGVTQLPDGRRVESVVVRGR